MRLFTGLELSQGVRGAIERAMGRTMVNLHITIKFIGEWPEARLGELLATLQSLPRRGPIHIELRGTVAKRRLLWASVDAGPELAALARETNDALAPLGIAREEKPYLPHVTLSRAGGPSLTDDDFGAFDAGEFHLYHSQPGASGSVYTKLATFSIAA